MIRRTPMKRGKPMRRIGKKGRENLKLVAELTERAIREGWYSGCELAPILSERKLTAHTQCLGLLTFAHSVKYHNRLGDTTLNQEAARGCSFHHMSVLDLLPPEVQAEVVREAIRRRA